MFWATAPRLGASIGEPVIVEPEQFASAWRPIILAASVCRLQSEAQSSAAPDTEHVLQRQTALTLRCSDWPRLQGGLQIHGSTSMVASWSSMLVVSGDGEMSVVARDASEL